MRVGWQGQGQQGQLICPRVRVALAAAVLGLHVAEEHAAGRGRARRQRLDPLRLLAPLGDLLEVDPILLGAALPAWNGNDKLFRLLLRYLPTTCINRYLL